MERFFEVTSQSGLYKEYMEYKNSEEVMHDIVKEFMIIQGIETSDYAYRGEKLYIVPTDKDLEKFEKSLCNPLGNGLMALKTNSKLGKAWVDTLDKEQVEIKYKPYVGFSFKNCIGKNRSRIFAINNIVYCSFENEYDFNDTPEGFIEIKASEFWKIVEDYNERKD